jgi:two-component sensor histidine kinase
MSLPAPRLLYIDDDEGLSHLARRRLARQGYEVTIAGSGQQGVALACGQDFDMVALDHYMPGQDGLETLAQLMALPSPPTVIYVTGSEETHIAVSALKAGAVDYVVKSVGEDFFDLLTRTLEQALAARRLAAEKEQVEQRLRETNQQLEAMLGEMNHRVANSLQMVSAMVNLQARIAKGEEARAVLTDIRQRIHAVGRVHRQLYVGGATTTIAMDSYIEGLAQDLSHSFSSESAPRAVRVSADRVVLPASMAVSMGILINELVSNACKYAYADGQPGEVRIVLRGSGAEDMMLAVEDDGAGYEAGITPRGTGLGSQIVRIMTETLGGTLSLHKGPGGFRVEFSRTTS